MTTTIKNNAIISRSEFFRKVLVFMYSMGMAIQCVFLLPSAILSFDKSVRLYFEIILLVVAWKQSTQLDEESNEILLGV